jgi:arabinofuranosyltransferase
LLSLDYESIFGKINNKGYALAVIIVLALGMSSSHPPIFIKASDAGRIFDEKKISNEKLYYYSFTSWIGHNQSQEIFHWSSNGIKLKNSGETFALGGSIGFFGYYAGPNVYILDTLALADPLLSRLPSSDSSRIGHFQRDIPDGYEETIKDDFNNHIVNQNLHRYYDKLDIIIHGAVFTQNRIEEIIKFNLGNYDYLAKRPVS